MAYKNCWIFDLASTVIAGTVCLYLIIQVSISLAKIEELKLTNS